jgi:hypothetical protein
MDRVEPSPADDMNTSSDVVYLGRVCVPIEVWVHPGPFTPSWMYADVCLERPQTAEPDTQFKEVVLTATPLKLQIMPNVLFPEMNND